VGEAPQLLAADVATAVALCGRLVAVGTRRGVVVLYDTQGKPVRAAAAGATASIPCAFKADALLAAQVCRLTPHRAAVNDISFNATGAYVATASEDGTVAVRRCVQAARALACADDRARPSAPQVASTNGEEHSVYEYHKAVKARPRSRPRCGKRRTLTPTTRKTPRAERCA
jgi:WD40 repeat protein